LEARVELKIFRSLWGVDKPWEQAFPLFKAEGFVGIEAGVPGADEAAHFRDLLGLYSLGYVAQIYTAGNTVAEHVRSFREQAEAAAAFGPALINSHSGQDSFTREQASTFFRETLRIEEVIGVPVAHETHRGRVLFNPWITRDLLRELPELKLCADYSHWVCVAERLLEDCADIMALAADRCLHLHARVGYEEGPQVPDPAAPEYRAELEAHEKWWDEIWDSQQRRGMRVSTLVPEFGPPRYLHTLPHTDVPIADLWKICVWQARRQGERFAARNR
jgi:sugar phosphate isomerase/epimerase